MCFGICVLSNGFILAHNCPCLCLCVCFFGNEVKQTKTTKHKHTHIYALTHIHNPYIEKKIDVLTHTHPNTHTHTLTHTYTHKHTPSHINTLIHAHARIYARTNKPSQTNTQKCRLLILFLLAHIQYVRFLTFSFYYVLTPM